MSAPEKTPSGAASAYRLSSCNRGADAPNTGQETDRCSAWTRLDIEGQTGSRVSGDEGSREPPPSPRHPLPASLGRPLKLRSSSAPSLTHVFAFRCYPLAMVQLMDKKSPSFTDNTTGAHVWLEVVTPERAKALLDANVGNRNLRARAVHAYVTDMEAGKWQFTGDTIKFAATGELLDGQHRLSSIAATGIPQPCLMVGGLELTVRDVIDTGATRTGGDALRLAGLGGASPHATAAAARLYRLWASGRLEHMSSGTYSRDRATHSEIIDAVRDNPLIIDAVRESVRDYDRTGLPVGPTAMARVVLSDVDGEDCIRFFESLAGYATDGPDDPRAALLFAVRRLRGEGQLRRPGETIGLLFTAWNAWRDGQKLSTMTVRDRNGKPLRIPTPV